MNKGLFIIIAAAVTFIFSYKSHACGHEGWYGGVSYMQLFQFSPDNQLVGGGIGNSAKVNFRTRYGAMVKAGKDFCGSRFGVEFPFSYNRQRLNRQEMINVFGMDANAVIHLVETVGGADFYLIAGTGINFIPRGNTGNMSKALGVNLNFGPGFQYFISKKPKIALGVSIPLKYTLYFGNNLSAKKTQVLGFPIAVGFTVAF